MSNKFYDYIAAENPEENKYTIFDTIFSRYYNSPQAWTKFRAPIKIGRFVNRIFPDIYKQNGVAGKDIESFVNVVKLKRTQQFERFKIVKGDDILKYYSESNYDERATDGTGLGNSCMRYSKCQQYLKFYPNNNVEMLILMSEDEYQKDKIVGRALLWDIKYINEVEVNRKFMDRIYVVNDFDIQNFKDYATKNKWLHKKGQNRNPGEAIYDPIDNTFNYLSLKTDNTFKKSKYYPYLDTMAYFYTDDGFLSNKSNLSKSEPPYFLQSTTGSYILEGMKYVEYYHEWINEDDLTWCEYGHEYRLGEDCIYIESSSEYATKEYAEENMNYSDIMEQWIDRDYSVYLEYYEDYVTENYASRYLTYSEYDNQWYKKGDVVYSNYHGTNILEDTAIEVIMNNEQDTDYRSKDDDSYLKYNKDGNTDYYDLDYFSDDFVKAKTVLGSNKFVWKHTEWDKDNLIQYENRWYFDIPLDKIKEYVDNEKG